MNEKDFFNKFSTKEDAMLALEELINFANVIYLTYQDTMSLSKLRYLKDVKARNEQKNYSINQGKYNIK